MYYIRLTGVASLRSSTSSQETMTTLSRESLRRFRSSATFAVLCDMCVCVCVFIGLLVLCMCAV